MPEILNQQTQNSKNATGTRKYVFLFIIGILVACIVLAGLYLLFSKQNHTSNKSNTSSSASPLPTSEPAPAQKPTDAIMKVGTEYIYAKDLATEMQNYPPVSLADKKKILLQKLISDSIILQGGSEDGLLNLDSSIFNSPDKDYTKRIAAVEKIKESITNKQDNISGGVVSLWFFNSQPGAVGYTQGQTIAKTKMQNVYNAVKNKKMTLTQAGNAIKSDASLKQVDTAYQENAYFAFHAGKGEKISFDPAFDAMLWKLTPGEITSLYLAKDIDPQTGEKIDAVYMFGEVTGKQSKGNTTDFNQWYTKKAKEYAVTNY